MAFTETDLANVEAAIAAIVAGDRVVSVTIEGETIEYQPTDENKLRALRRDIMAEIAASATSQKNVFYTMTRKGL